MYNFCFHLSTKVYFGTNQLHHLQELKEYGNAVLMVYGGGSIKRSGLYDAVLTELKTAGLQVFELPGVEPNPRIESVRAGAALCKENNIDMVLAVGGGSTIDCSKVIAAAAKYDGDAWDLVDDASKITAALPIFDVLTAAATGTEMNHIAVISNLDINVKFGTRHELMRPTMSILDPTLTYTVSEKQTTAGTADIISHAMENYFTREPGVDIQQGFAESIIKTCMKYGPIALAEPDNYEARANLMWASSHAINGLCSAGSQNKWSCHPMEHELSAFYDITHGVGLAILTPVWMEHILNSETEELMAKFARNIFGLDHTHSFDDHTVALQGIEALKDFFFNTLGLPSRLSEVGISDNKNFEIMAEKALKNCVNTYAPLTKEGIIAIFEDCL